MKIHAPLALAFLSLTALAACTDDGQADADEASETGTDSDIGDTTTTDTTTTDTTTTDTTEETTDDTTDTTEESTEESTDDTTEESTEESTDDTTEESTEEGPECMGNDGLSADTAGASCLEILENGCSIGDGTYWVAPGDVPFETNCDMSTEGGGWTQISLASLCNGDLNVSVTAVEAAIEEGIDASCRPFTADGPDDHTYYMDVEFLPSFEAFYLSGYSMRANGDDPSGIIGSSSRRACGTTPTATRCRATCPSAPARRWAR